ALHLVATEPERRAQLLRNAGRLRRGLAVAGLRAEGDTHIIPVMLGDNALAMRFAEALLARGVLAHAIRPPTVPPRPARLGVTPRATPADAQLDRALAASAGAARTIGATPCPIRRRSQTGIIVISGIRSPRWRTGSRSRRSSSHVGKAAGWSTRAAAA